MGEAILRVETERAAAGHGSDSRAEAMPERGLNERG